MKYIKRRIIESKSTGNMIIPDLINELSSLFKKNGYKLYLVGGSVRDFITGDKPKDFDLATDALPKQIIDMLSPKYDVRLQGKAFGVVVIKHSSIPGDGVMEIATFRKDLTKGRNPEVQLGVTIDEDVLRRDITFNALFYDIDKKEIVDLVGGQKDLNNKIVRMVGDPVERIDEDRLRILRVFRFASRYGSKLDERTKEAIKKHNLLEDVSQERIWGEFVKSFYQAKNFQQYLNFITEFNMWNQIFPGWKINPKISDQSSIDLVLAQIFNTETDLNKLSKLMNDVWKTTEPKKTNDRVIFLLSLLNFDVDNIQMLYKKKKSSEISNDDINKWFEINNITDPMISKFTKYVPTVNANELMDEMGLKPGPEVGKLVKQKEIERYKLL